MIKKDNPKILLTGFADDLEKVALELNEISTDIKHVTETAENTDLPKATDVVIYVLSGDTGYSSQLRLVFFDVHNLVLSSEEFLLPIEDVDLNKSVFPEISKLPRISISNLKRKLGNRKMTHD
jgi:hypothetical protein